MLGQILTIVFSLFYGYISFEYKYYGELITYVGMTAVVALISVITWIKHPYDDKEVEVASLNKNKIILRKNRETKNIEILKKNGKC